MRNVDKQKDTDYAFRKYERYYLDTNSPVPLYHQMEQVIFERISGDDMLGRMLPSEAELMEIFAVSRITVKKALDNLSVKGLLDRRRALGTRITRPTITEDLARLSSYTEEMESKGLSIRTEILYAGIHTPDAGIRELLRIREDEHTLCVRRLRGTNEVFPVVLLQTEIPVSFGISPDQDFHGSLYRILEQKYRISIVGAQESISASQATGKEAKLLGIGRGDSVLVMERLTQTRDNRPLEYVKAIYRPDRYKFSIKLRR